MTNPFDLPDTLPQAQAPSLDVAKFTPNFAPELKAQIDTAINELAAIGAIQSQDDVVKANAHLKIAKVIVKRVEEERKAMTSILDEAKKQAMAKEKEITSSLLIAIDKANTAIVEFQREVARKEAERLAEIERKRKEEEAKIEAERKAEAALVQRVSDMKSGLLKAYTEATLATIDSYIARAKSLKVTEDQYGRFCGEIQSLISEYQVKFETRKAELIALEKLELSNKQAADDLRAKQQYEAAKEAERIAEQKKAEDQRIRFEQAEKLANAQMTSEFAETQIISEKSNVRKVWKFEVVNLALVPANFLTIDDAKVKAAIAEGAREIPGLKIFQDIQNVAR